MLCAHSVTLSLLCRMVRTHASNWPGLRFRAKLTPQALRCAALRKRCAALLSETTLAVVFVRFRRWDQTNRQQNVCNRPKCCVPLPSGVVLTSTRVGGGAVASHCCSRPQPLLHRSAVQVLHRFVEAQSRCVE